MNSSKSYQETSLGAWVNFQAKEQKREKTPGGSLRSRVLWYLQENPRSTSAEVWDGLKRPTDKAVVRARISDMFSDNVLVQGKTRMCTVCNAPCIEWEVRPE